MKKYISQWLKDFWGIFTHELKQIFSDGGVMIIFFVAGFGYPLLYNIVYRNGVLNDIPVAVVDNADCSASRNFIRKLDATREIDIAYHCVDMEDAKELMQKREVNGIVMFPADFGDKLARSETAKLSIYADMSSFLYYKNLLLGTEFVMLDDMQHIEVERYEDSGLTAQEASQLVKAIPYEENNPYNRTFSYSIFLLSAVLLLIVQQTMFYGMCLLSGTAREEHRSMASFPAHLQGHGMGRVVLGKGGAYWLVYWGIAVYIACIVPAIFGLPQRGSFTEILVLLFFFLTDCVFFCQAWSSLITRRETVFVLLLFISPILLFLTGFSWPTSAFPQFWKWFSYLFPSTFACQGFINLNTAGGDLTTIRPIIMCLTLQGVIYYFLANVAVFVENWYVNHQEQIREKREALEAKARERVREKMPERMQERVQRRLADIPEIDGKE